MVGYKYNEFEIKHPPDSKATWWGIYKDGFPYSMLALSSPKIAKRVLDIAFPKYIKADLKPFNY